jgi:ribonucleoside-diphosphate reductase alpha chain
VAGRELRRSKKPGGLDRSRIARAIFAAAETMGISDRQRLEQLASDVFDRLEQPPVLLPGMEHLAPPVSSLPQRPIADWEIDAMVKEVLDGAKPASIDKSDTEEEPVMTLKPRTDAAELTENALRVLERRYLKKDKNGDIIETPQEMFRRVARTVAAAELIYDAKADVRVVEEGFYRLMTSLQFLPNSPTLMNAGRELGQLSACFVLPVLDSMESIFDAVKHTALIHKSGGGTGFSFSSLRPEKERVGSTGGVASGPVSFMRAFDVATDVIKQGGTRRGANMAILSIDHPDILKFIHAKDDPAVLTNFNLSVAVTDEFMRAVKEGGEYDLINPHNAQVARKENAGEVFDKIVAMTWKTGDPGVVFIDRINEKNPTPQLGRIESTNPCGEQPLLPYESCNLGSINLARMLKETDGRFEVDYARLAETAKMAVRFLDNVIDVNKFPIDEIAEMTRKTRKVGLGVMGFADMLLKLGISYNSEAALRVAEDVMAVVNDEAHKASAALAAERGAFPAFAGSVYDTPGGTEMRNASCTTIAPTGTLSLIAGCSSGIEPLFALSYTRNILDGAHLVEVNPYFEKAAREGGFYSSEMMKELAGGGHLESIEGVPDAVKQLFVTAHSISPQSHVRMQAAFQRHTDNAVSKTVNFPSEATREDVAEVYNLAYQEGLKGITIYRDGSREAQPLQTGKSAVKEEAPASALAPRKRAKRTTGITERVTTGCGYIYVTVNSDERGICEVFSFLGKTGGCASAQLEATCRLISLALRSGIKVEAVVKQLRGIRCPSLAWEDGKAVLSCADAIASVLERHMNGDEADGGNGNGGKAAVADYGLVKNIAGQCPECTSILVYQEGCFICPGCGYTKC